MCSRLRFWFSGLRRTNPSQTGTSEGSRTVVSFKVLLGDALEQQRCGDHDKYCDSAEVHCAS
ncbi:protein of unknown function [Methanoculleus bourgensis]|uniref:Uncharacterized protein n=1 Tax=Methanoculleus bourgensis TaxID=83986 RepID=A0A0X3BMD3_9EURY|nr:protein of unknown function [Methanoculleus bourgensis]